jgi:hypothetical protein
LLGLLSWSHSIHEEVRSPVTVKTREIKIS